MWVQLVMSKLQDMTFVAAEDDRWPRSWEDATGNTGSRKDRARYGDIITAYTGLVDMRHALAHGREVKALDISRRHGLVDRQKVLSTLEDFWTLFRESSEEAEVNLVWPAALMREINVLYEGCIGDEWDFSDIEIQDDDGETRQVNVWKEAVSQYYKEVTDLVMKVWTESRDLVPKSEDGQRWETFTQAMMKWKWVRQWTAQNPYYDFPLPTHSFLRDAFDKFVELQDAFGWVSTVYIAPTQRVSAAGTRSGGSCRAGGSRDA